MGILNDAMDYLADKNEAPALVEYVSAFYFYKQGDRVIVESYGAKLNPQSQFLSVGTLSHSSLIPQHEVIAPMTWGPRSQLNGLIKITTSGVVYVYIETTTSGVEAWCNLSYFV
jgi:hypothetical protein